MSAAAEALYESIRAGTLDALMLATKLRRGDGGDPVAAMRVALDALAATRDPDRIESFGRAFQRAMR